MTTEERMTSPNGLRDGNDPYFIWLCRRVGIGPARPYMTMARLLHYIPFKPSKRVQMDYNRAYDGLQLRVKFMQKHGEEGSSVNRGTCTSLEFLVGLSERMAFLMDEENIGFYFWQIVRNLRLLGLTDEVFEEKRGEFFVEEAMQRVFDRSYGSDGDGGLFPLRYPREDQRDVDIWYQMQAWLGERYEIRGQTYGGSNE